MPPTARITKQAILSAGIALIREQGPDALNARTLAARLNCSTQPIFSNFPSMDALRLSLVAQAEALYQACIEAEIAQHRYPPYKASGMAYIRFAQEEPQLFRLLYMRDRSREEEGIKDHLTPQMIGMVQENTALDAANAGLFHLEMWAFVHGLAVLCATNFCPIDEESLSHMITDVFQGLKKRHECKEESH
ncbi:MAG: TetR/AcrR family transcriptional regulator [Clostridiales bacterium]|nr:TetR/AcrR family transcriptional regulator [Clostridiales bacterium]